MSAMMTVEEKPGESKPVRNNEEADVKRKDLLPAGGRDA
jgi:hypothetical protein